MDTQLVVLCGGIGSRLKPLSRPEKPKQFLVCPDHGCQTFVKRTEKLFKPCCTGTTLFSTKKEYSKYFSPEDWCHFEYPGKETAWAIIQITLLLSASSDSDKLVLIVPSDHHIRNQKSVVRDVEKAKKQIEEGQILLFGIPPQGPDSRFGYILPPPENSSVLSFVEKPNEDKARELLQKGALWNSGIILASVKTLTKLCEKYLNSYWQVLYPVFFTNKRTNILDYPTVSCPDSGLPFDIAVLQKTKRISLFPTQDWKWDDIGSWNAWFHNFSKSYTTHFNEKLKSYPEPVKELLGNFFNYISPLIYYPEISITENQQVYVEWIPLYLKMSWDISNEEISIGYFGENKIRINVPFRKDTETTISFLISEMRKRLPAHSLPFL